MDRTEWEVHQEQAIPFYEPESDSQEWYDSEYILTIEQRAEEYGGAYSFTPTSEAQTIPTQDKLLLEDITINPIPSNYGLITYDGSIITVS